MAKLGDVYVLINGDDKGLRTAFNRSEQSTRSWAGRVGSTIRSAFTGALSTAAGFIAAQVSLRALSSAIRGVSDSAIGMNSTLETTELQFSTLMGDADLARKHVEMLFEFAKRTPFETQPIINASLKLRQFGRDALDNEENLLLLGDAAAATNASIEDLSEWVGRLYSSIQIGEPVGLATRRLMELAVLSPEARVQIERLTESGAEASEIWAVLEKDLSRFSGSMERQASTWKGLTSTISDSWQLLGATALKPIFDLGKQLMGSLARWLDSEGVQQAAENIAGSLQGIIDKARATMQNWLVAFATMDRETVVRIGRIIGYLRGLTTFAAEWGLNIGRVLAQGIRLAVGYVTYALEFLGQVIARLLRPGSPPQLLPDLDKWGTGAAEAWLDGWLDADFNALEEFGGLVQGLLQDMASAGQLDEMAVIPMTLAIRRGFAQILQAAKESGEVSEDLFAAIRREAGPAGEEVEGLARRYARVAVLTSRLAAIQAELTAMDRKEEAQQYAGRARQLREILADPRTTASQRARATQELERIDLLEEQTKLEGELAEAQSDLDAYTARLGIERETLSLMGQQVQMAEALADALGDVDLSGAAGGLQSAADDLELAVEGLGGAVEGLSSIPNPKADFDEFHLSELTEDFEELRTTFREAIAEGEEAVGGLMERLGLSGKGKHRIEVFLGGLQITLDGLTTKLAEARLELQRGAGAAAAAKTVGDILAWVVKWGWTEPVERLYRSWSDLKESWDELKESATPFAESLDSVRQKVEPLVTAVENLASALGIKDTEGLGPAWDMIVDKLWTIINFSNPFVRMKSFIDGLKGSIDLLRQALEFLVPYWDKLWGQEGEEPAIPSTPTQTPTPSSPVSPPSIKPSYSRAAGGTARAQGGYALVGELGRELVYLPEGARVWSAGTTAQMLGGGFRQIIVTVPGVTVNNQQDVAELAYEVAREINRRTH